MIQLLLTSPPVKACLYGKIAPQSSSEIICYGHLCDVRMLQVTLLLCGNFYIFCINIAYLLCQFVHVFLSNMSSMSFEERLFDLPFFGPGWPPSLFRLLVANNKFRIPLLRRITFIPFAKDNFHEITF